jgi:hypothetical protein
MKEDNVVNIFNRQLEPESFTELGGGYNEILLYLNYIVEEHRHAHFLKAMINPLLAKSIMLDPSVLHGNIEYKNDAIPYSLYSKNKDTVTVLTLDVYGKLEEAYPTYKDDYGPIVKEHLEDTLRASKCQESLIRFCYDVTCTYRHVLKDSFFVNYEPNAYQLIIPVNEEMTIDITITSEKATYENQVQRTDT